MNNNDDEDDDEVILSIHSEASTALLHLLFCSPFSTTFELDTSLQMKHLRHREDKELV